MQSRARIESELPLYAGPTHRCAYLPGRVAKDVFAIDPGVDSAAYQQMMDAGYRRSGRVFYRPTCDGCRECVPIRVPVAEFAASKSQRRVQRRNEDVRVEIARPRATDRKWEIFAAYQAAAHDGKMCDERADFERYLYDSPIDTLEFTYWVGRRLAGVGIVDACPGCLSSVYFYYDPVEAKRSLGVFSALREIEECRARRLPYWYIGFYVRGCAAMSYKAGYRPYELLGEGGEWRRAEQESRATDCESR